MSRQVRIVQTTGAPSWEVRALVPWRDPHTREMTDYLAGFRTQGAALSCASMMGMRVEGVERRTVDGDYVAGQGRAAA